MPRLGVIGTMVWDRIHARDGRVEPVEEWGGISYALAGLAAARAPEWEIVPILKLGQDLEERAREFLRTIPGLDMGALRSVPEPTNRVELRYFDRDRRTEQLRGGVPPWRWEELAPIVADVDALYINFISGFELDLETAIRVRLGFPGPIYADLHSLFLGIDPQGNRALQPLAGWREWLRCFDIVQVNEDELRWLAHAWGDPWRFASEVVDGELRLLLVTLAARGAAYVASPAFRPAPLTWHPRGVVGLPPLAIPGATTSGHILPDLEVADGDPTGCGDVWGATCFLRLLSDDPLEVAMRAANRAAARNVRHRGARGLYEFLLGRIAT
jgi:sugar/nucleoside kinase (ribokinase family)